MKSTKGQGVWPKVKHRADSKAVRNIDSKSILSQFWDSCRKGLIILNISANFTSCIDHLVVMIRAIARPLKNALDFAFTFVMCNLFMPNVKHGSKVIWPDKPTIRTEGGLLIKGDLFFKFNEILFA